jgi:gag-polyprotein putative aspartyl protease
MRPVSYRGLTVPARINGRSGYFVVDTGAAHTLLSQNAIAGLNMRLASAARFWTRSSRRWEECKRHPESSLYDDGDR